MAIPSLKNIFKPDDTAFLVRVTGIDGLVQEVGYQDYMLNKEQFVQLEQTRNLTECIIEHISTNTVRVRLSKEQG